MGLFTWIKGLLQPKRDTIRVNCQTMSLAKWQAMKRHGGYQPCSHGGTPNPPPSDFDDYLDCEIARRRGSNPPAPGNRPAAPSGPPAKPQPTGGRLIYGDRGPSPVQPCIPDGLADLPGLTAELPSDQQMERWKRAAIAEYQQGGEPTWRTSARLAFAEGQQQAQSLQIPPPGAEPVATDGDLLRVLDPILWAHDARRALYNLGRSDERTAILRSLGVEP
jgi:hypothetical protein